MNDIKVQYIEEEPTCVLMFCRDTSILFQQWKILEWGNSAGVGIPMKIRKEWRKVSTGWVY